MAVIFTANLKVKAMIVQAEIDSARRCLALKASHKYEVMKHDDLVLDREARRLSRQKRRLSKQLAKLTKSKD
jgi:hypothetical protein